ncbi:MAG: sigma-54-dependent Fis family transcriptional regulator [Planctomycetes bacterium]|nr:sigma-54-dependent Fis family transcriptional regulator [Planctomycetota bacterium]
MAVCARILIVDDERIKRSILEDELRAGGYDVVTAENPLQAEPKMKRTAFDVIVTDLRMPGQDGLSFLRQIKQRQPDQQVIVMTAYGTVETAVEAMKLGAFDYLLKPFATEELLLKIDRLMQYRRLASENEALRQQLAVQGPSRIIGQSESIRRLLARIHMVAPTDSTVLIEGESGTGKELVARMLHETSHRSRGPFVAVSCAALPKDLIESELFGHEPGAFTGATRQRTGRFELAHGGTLFLDEVDDIPMEVQVKLLRVLQERAFDRIGGEGTVQANVRVVAATKRPISPLVEEGRFREDLYYRLSVVPLHIPPLRERTEDIPCLVEFFLQRLATRLNRDNLSVTHEAMRKLREYSWPGNVRQLEHVLEQMAALSSHGTLDVSDLPVPVLSTRCSEVISLSLEGRSKVDLATVLEEAEAALVQWAVQKCGGNLSQAADALGIARSTLQYKMAKLNGREGLWGDGFPAGDNG